MSGNQNKTAGGGPQNQRYNTAVYQSISQQPRTDGYHVQPQPYVPQQQPNQPGNQAQNLRGIPQAGPPNQSSTPPTNDLKVQSVPQQQPMNHMYVAQQQVRGTQQNYYRNPGPPNQTPRMQNQHRQNQQQQLYPAQHQYVQMPQLYLANAMPFYNGQRPPAATYVPPPLVYASSAGVAPQYSFQPNQTGGVSFPYYPAQIRPGHTPQPASVPQNAPPALQPMPMPQPNPQPSQFQRKPYQRRANAIAIIDPVTGVDHLDEIIDKQNSSHPASGETSARQTPQPQPQPSINTKEVQAAFAKQVAQAMNEEPAGANELQQPPMDMRSPPIVPEPDLPPVPFNHAGAVPPSSRLDHLVQQSNLKVQAPEFVLNYNNTAKETTPIVSANCDAVEVTLPNKQAKDRESPAKGRKPHGREHKESVKEVPIREYTPISGDKDSSIISSKTSSSNSSSKEALSIPVQPPAAVPVAAVAAPTPVVSKEPVQHQDKKINKKDSKTDDKKVPNVVDVNNDCANVAAAQPIAQQAQDASLNAKSKNASRTKEVQKQQLPPVASQKPVAAAPAPAAAPAVIPPPQPAKTGSKASKKSELNMKGANKEGTDMDAFNDNAHLDAVNANVNDEINANSVVVNDSEPVTQPPASAVLNAVNDFNKNCDDNADVVEAPPAVPAAIIRTEPAAKVMPKSRIDITDIVREKPKQLNFPTPAEIAQDEIDRAPLINDKLVQAKNEANAKSSENSSGLIDGKGSLPYKDGQWTPENMDGKRVYERDFLLALRNGPASMQKPVNLPDGIIADERDRVSGGGGRYSSMGGRTDFTTPPFVGYGSRSNSQRGTATKRDSQRGKLGGNDRGGGGGGKGSKSQIIKVSISVREDVKLHESENAWKPARMNKGDEKTEEGDKTAELYKKVRGVLNRLTPQKFDTLVSQVRELQIDTAQRLQGVIDLVFEKAVDEPNFSVAYALMCRELALMQVPADGTNIADDKSNVVNFRKLLVTRCQMEFEKQSFDESAKADKMKVIEACTDPEKKKELQFELEETDRRLRMKSVGNIRFIGELFKQQMLTIKIMVRCLDNLANNKDEESLECLCKLLTTIGKELESKKIDLGHIFNIMQEIVDKKHGKMSSRVRFMIQDVIDLKRKDWKPRRTDSNPKTIDQIQKEADNEQMNIQAMNMVPMTPRKDDRNSSNAGPNSDRKRRNVADESGWQVSSSRNNRSTSFTVQSDKLKSKAPLTDAPLGGSQMFSNWSKGSNIKTDSSTTPNTANIYTALEALDTDKRPTGQRQMNKNNPYSSKGSSLERNYSKQFDGRGSRSGSQHRSNEWGDNLAPTSQKAAAPVVPASAVPKPAAPAPAPEPAKLSPDQLHQLERHVKNNLDEYLNDNCTIEEYDQDTQATVPLNYLSRIVADGHEYVLERSAQARRRTGKLFAQLILLGSLPLNEYCVGLENILCQAEDLIIDIPKFWDYLGEILVYLICDEALPLSRLHKSCKGLVEQGCGAALLAPLFKLVVSEKGPNFLTSIWQISGLSLENFVKPEEVEQFVNSNKFEFLIGGSTTPGENQLTYDQIHSKMCEFFSSQAAFDDIVNWLTANVGDRVTDNKFIRTLATAIFENSIVRQKLVVDNLKEHYKLLQKYVDNTPKYELQCLYALQALVNKMEHPQGLLLSACDKLYEDSVISQESFEEWETSKDPAEQGGKGVALMQLTSFFTQLKENDDGSSSDET